jgi:tyrosinase
MRLSVLFDVAAVASAMVVSAGVVRRQGAHQDLAIFSTSSQKFVLISPEKVAADAGKANAAFNPDLVPRPQDAAPAVAAASTCTNPEVRYEWRNLTDQQKTNYMTAMKCLLQSPSKTSLQAVRNRLDDLTAVHQKYSSTIHNVGQFLPWHRYYLHILKVLLRDECNYPGPMTWWDETKDAGNFNKAPMFTNAYFGSAPIQRNGQGTCITTGVCTSLL